MVCCFVLQEWMAGKKSSHSQWFSVTRTDMSYRQRQEQSLGFNLQVTVLNWLELFVEIFINEASLIEIFDQNLNVYFLPVINTFQKW